MSATFYSYSVDEERYSGDFASREAAIAEAFATYTDAQFVFTGLNVPFQPDWDGAAESALEQLECQAGDESGEVAEDWFPSNNKEIRSRVAAAIEAAVTELDRPYFFTVENVERHEREGASMTTGEPCYICRGDPERRQFCSRCGDIVFRLRELDINQRESCGALLDEAADEIERLREEDRQWDKHGLVEIVRERDRYKQALQRANGFLIMHNLEPVKLEYDEAAARCPVHGTKWNFGCAECNRLANDGGA